MKDEQITYIQYARKSTEGEDRQVLSIEGQLKDNQQVIERNGLTVIETISDSASASIPNNRPGYTKVIRMIKQGKANGIVVWHINRLVRNELEDGEFRWLLRNGIIKSIWTPTREYRSADNSLLLSIETSMASQYTRDLSVNIKRGLRQQWAQGNPCGVAKIGYLNTKFQTHGTNYIIKDPERFPIIKKAFELLLSRQYNVPEIQAKLTYEYGLRTKKSKKLGGGPIALSVLYRTFSDIFYTGHFYREGTLYKGNYPPMVSIEEFNTIQAILKRPLLEKSKKHAFAFTGLMKCGACGCAITASKKLKTIKATGEIKTYTFYHCTKRRGKATCTETNYVTEKEMVTKIATEVRKLNLIPKWKSWAVETIKEEYQAELEKSKDFLKSVKEHERKVHTELDRLLDLRIANEITEAQYNQKKSQRQLELLTIQEKIKRLQSNLNYQDQELTEILNFSENVADRFVLEDHKEQKAICQYFGWNWVLQQKSLTFTRENWFYDVEEMSSYYEANKQALEPIKTFAEYRQTSHFQFMLLTLRRM